MKRTNRLIALLLSLLLAVSLIASASAATLDYTLDEKFERQLSAGSGFRGEIAFTAEGDELATLDAATLTSLKVMFPLIKIPITYIQSGTDAELSVAQASLAVTGSAETLLASLVRRDELYTLQSALLGNRAIAIEKDSGTIERAVTGNDNQWPSLAPALLRLLAADSEYTERLTSALTPYLTKLGIFLQGYTKVDSLRDAQNVRTTVSTVTIPAAAFIAQTKQMLVDLYADEALLSLLAERLTARENAAYLQPGMLPTFYVALDRLAFSGEIAIHREYDAQGVLTLSEIAFPFAEGQALRALTIRETTDAEGARHVAIAGELKKQNETSENGATFDVTLISDAGAAGETLLSGTVSYLAEESPDDGFQVGDAARKPAKANFSLYINEGIETFDSVIDLCKREREITLVLKPVEGDEWHAVSLSATLDMQSASARRASINLTAALILQDLQTGAALRATLTGRTVAPWTIVAPEATDPIRADLMDTPSLKKLLEDLFAELNVNLSTLPATLLDAPQG